MTRERKILIAVLLVACLVSFVYETIKHEQSAGEAEQERGQVLASVYGYYIISEQGIRSRGYSQCDLTDDYVFFAYSTERLVDAYDMEGNFAFCICMEKGPNGAIGIRCEENRLYVEAVNGDVYVFEGDTCVDTISGEDARKMGYRYEWFQNRETPLVVDRNYLYLQDTEGNKTILMEKPQQIKNGKFLVFTSVAIFGAALILKVLTGRKERRKGVTK